MKRTPLRQIGKTGRANILANKKIKKYIQENALTEVCEMQLDGCLGSMFLTIAHKNKRAWYKGNIDLLSDYKQWVVACVECHNKQEHDKDLTERLFSELRG